LKKSREDFFNTLRDLKFFREIGCLPGLPGG